MQQESEGQSTSGGVMKQPPSPPMRILDEMMVYDGLLLGGSLKLSTRDPANAMSSLTSSILSPAADYWPVTVTGCDVVYDTHFRSFLVLRISQPLDCTSYLQQYVCPPEHFPSCHQLLPFSMTDKEYVTARDAREKERGV